MITLLLAASLMQSAAPASPAARAPEDHFEALVAEIATLRADLDRLARRERGLLGEMDRIETEAALRAREIDRLRHLRALALRDHEAATADLERSRLQVARAESGLAGHLRNVYTMGRGREARVLLALSEPVDLLRGLAYLDALARRESSLLERLRRGRAETEAVEATLRVRAENLGALAAQASAKARDMESLREQARDLLKETRAQGEASREAIAELSRAAGELEAAIVASRGLLGHNDAGAGPAAGAATPAVDAGRLQGALEWPVDGVVAVAFGDIRHPRFGTVTPHPGIDIETSPRSPVRAILAGRVAFARRFSGYGNTVLLDHGGGYMSVYARAAVLSVAEGDDVVIGQVLGHGADEGFDAGPPRVYFEFRRDGVAVDPALWLKRKPHTGERNAHE